MDLNKKKKKDSLSFLVFWLLLIICLPHENVTSSFTLDLDDGSIGVL